MTFLLHDTLIETAARAPAAPLLVHQRSDDVDAATMLAEVRRLAAQLAHLGIGPDDRVAVFLPKLPVTAIAFYATSMAGAVFVPVNPVLKSAQVAHILNDCAVRVLITSSDRAQQIDAALQQCPALEAVLLTDAPGAPLKFDAATLTLDDAALAASFESPPRIDNDMAAILYTSGSTGKPKGVVVSHRNVVTGAESVSQYLGISASDRLLAVLPFSFDAGLNQLTSAVLRGATCVLLDYLLPRDVLKAIVRHKVTGLAAVPPLWTQLAPLEWPAEAKASLRYITNTGGAMPAAILERLRASLPNTAPYLMYGLTEAFRSTYLPPDQIDRRPNSMGKAIPNAEILVINANGDVAAPHEHGELVHRGALVALGYWNDPERSAERFKPAPGRPGGLPFVELAVWSGDTVYKDEDGYLYFVGRNDGMIKTSGYRVSPEELEELVYACDNNVQTTAAVGVPHAALGQAVVLVVQTVSGTRVDEDELLAQCKRSLPNYMVPSRVIFRHDMPHNPNGKINRRQLAEDYAALFADTDNEGVT